MDTLKKHVSSTNHIAKNYLTQIHKIGRDQDAMTYWPKSLLEKRKRPLGKKTKELQHKNADDVMTNSMLKQSSSKTCSVDKEYLEIIDVNKILSPGDKIDLTKAIVFDADKLSITETAEGSEKRATNSIEGNNEEQSLLYKPIEKLIFRAPIPINKPSVKEGEKKDSDPSTNKVEKVDFDTFILEQNKITEAEQGELKFVLFKKFEQINE